ncbi:hypothetical protein ACTXT7_016512 [Hymenolepis weldensis]
MSEEGGTLISLRDFAHNCGWCKVLRENAAAYETTFRNEDNPSDFSPLIGQYETGPSGNDK